MTDHILRIRCALLKLQSDVFPLDHWAVPGAECVLGIAKEKTKEAERQL